MRRLLDVFLVLLIIGYMSLSVKNEKNDFNDNGVNDIDKKLTKKSSKHWYVKRSPITGICYEIYWESSHRNGMSPIPCDAPKIYRYGGEF